MHRSHGKSQMCCQGRRDSSDQVGAEKVPNQTQNGVRVRSGQNDVTLVTSLYISFTFQILDFYEGAGTEK